MLNQNLLQAQTFSIGKLSIGESRIKVELEDFLIKHTSKSINTKWINNSVQWIRNETNMMYPRALLNVEDLAKNKKIYLKYQNKIILLGRNEESSGSNIYINLFSPEPILVFEEDRPIDTITIEAKSVVNARSKQLIDYSCAPYDLKIDGIDSEYLSVGCKMYRLGKFASERPRLEVTLSSTNLKTLSNEPSPFTLYLESSNHSEIEVMGSDQKKKTLKIEALLPKELNRFKTSLGFGPYIYQSQYNTAVQNSNIAPSIMLYGKFDFNETTSLKGFDALLYSKTFFNNSGVYFSYDLAEILDGRVLINTLLGFQGLHFKYSPQTPTQFRLIYPQGFEVLYKHAFIQNYSLFYGMFFSTSAEQYTNTWIRYGKRGFIELNYINWGLGENKIKMWGLSIGIPFLSFL